MPSSNARQLYKLGPYQQHPQVLISFRCRVGMERDPLELVRYAESECQAWFNANKILPHIPQDHIIEEPQVLSLGNICMIDGSWTSTSQFSGSGWGLDG
uniref:Uncharacterized protein n=1 Tax=Brassica oleracea TaxID=3712 RepID=A0A3P6EKW7_BRAOL|nr:unnamed protein product [Brassica oleracea]